MEAQGSGEGKDKRRRTMPCEHTPDCSGKPTAHEVGRGLGTESGEKLENEAQNVPYKKRKIKNLKS